MNNFALRLISSLILIPTVFFIIINGSYLLKILILVCFCFTVIEWFSMIKNKIFMLIGFIFIIFSFYAFYSVSKNFNLVIFVVSICISTDLGGYIFGKFFKGPKLTIISPNKTYSGMIGSFIFSFICLKFLSFYFEMINLSVELFILTFVISAISQIGDLLLSYFKRKSNIKDTGKIIPGHGGLLDRIDGMIFVFPIIYLTNLTGIFLL